MALATALAAVGAATAIGSAIKGAGAGNDAARAQGQIAKDQYAMAEKAAAFAAPTSEELNTLSNQVKLYDTAYGNAQAQLSTLQKEITDTYGSNIIEMGQQLHAQLTGANSVIAQKASEQVERQRAQYQQQLVDKLGPGALTSSAGIQAMATFNREASNSMAQVQEQSLNNMISRLGGLQGAQSSAVSGVSQINESLRGMLGSIQNTQNMFQQRQSNAWNNLAQYAGADKVQQLQEAKNSANTWNAIGNVGGMALGAGLSSLAKTSPAATTANAGASPTLASGQFTAGTLGDGSFGGLGGNFNFQQYDPSVATQQSPAFSLSQPNIGDSYANLSRKSGNQGYWGN